MTEFKDEQVTTMTVDENQFIIKYENKQITINGFPLTINQWQQVIDGKSVTLKNGGESVTVTLQRGNIIFDGKLFTGGSNTSIRISQPRTFVNIGSGFTGTFIDWIV